MSKPVKFADQNHTLRRSSLYILFLIFLAPLCLLHSGCANIIPPGGGPIDSIPPRLVKSSPKDSALNFTGNKIELVFNEFVELDNVSQEVIMSPTTKSTPQIERKLNVVTVKLRDTLDANTTYSINFGNSIKDLNEGNKASQFTYTFSTGSEIHSLSLQGKLLMAETGKSDSTLIVALYKNLDDSAVAKERPRYYTKLNGKGEFMFRNLPAEKFTVFALKDDNGNKRYDDKREIIAFLNEPVTVSADIAPITLFAFAESKEGKLGAASIGKSAEPKKGLKPADESLKLASLNTQGPVLDLLDDLEISFNKPVQRIDSSLIELTDELFNRIKKFSYQLDSTRKKITIGWSKAENAGYHVILPKGFASDSSGNAFAKTDTIRFQTAKESSYGSFRINFKNISKYNNPVLQLVQNGAIVASYKLVNPDLIVPLFHPAVYELRILEDRNGNGKWDTGNYWNKQQPEQATLLNNSLSVKPSWDTEITINL